MIVSTTLLCAQKAIPIPRIRQFHCHRADDDDDDDDDGAYRML